MAEKIKPYVKRSGDLTFSTLEGSGLSNLDPKLGVAELLKSLNEERGFFKNLFSGEVPAAVKITTNKSDFFIFVGYKKEGDQEDLNVIAVKTPNGRTYDIDPPLVLQFDKNTDPEKGRVKGAVTGDSAEKLVKTLNQKLAQDNIPFVPDAHYKSNPREIKEAVGNVPGIPKYPMKDTSSVEAPNAGKHNAEFRSK